MNEKNELVMAVVLENGAVAHMTQAELEEYRRDPSSMECTMTGEEMWAAALAELEEDED